MGNSWWGVGDVATRWENSEERSWWWLNIYVHTYNKLDLNSACSPRKPWTFKLMLHCFVWGVCATQYMCRGQRTCGSQLVLIPLHESWTLNLSNSFFCKPLYLTHHISGPWWTHRHMHTHIQPACGHHDCLVSMKIRRGSWIIWNWS